MRGPTDLPDLAELIREHRRIFELLSESDLPISENAESAIEWIDNGSTSGGAER